MSGIGGPSDGHFQRHALSSMSQQVFGDYLSFYSIFASL